MNVSLGWTALLLVYWVAGVALFLAIGALPEFIKSFAAEGSQEQIRSETPTTGSLAPLSDPMTFLNVFGADFDRRDEAQKTCNSVKEDLPRFKNCLAVKYQVAYGEAVDWMAFEASYQERLDAASQRTPAKERQSFLEVYGAYYTTSVLVLIGFSLAASLLEFTKWVSGKDLSLAHLHGWLIDAPPILGISGTLFALIVFLAEVGSGDAIRLFLPAFSTAAVTTLAGSLAAVVNHLLLSFAVEKS